MYFKSFLVTGLYYNSTRKFSNRYTSWPIANGINLWRGRVWGITENNKKVLVKKVWN